MTEHSVDMHDVPSYEGVQATRWTWPIIWALLLYGALLSVALVNIPKLKVSTPQAFVKASVVHLPKKAQDKVTDVAVAATAKPKTPKKNLLSAPKQKKQIKKHQSQEKNPPPQKQLVASKKSLKKEDKKSTQAQSEFNKKQRRLEEKRKHQEWLDQQWHATLNELDLEQEEQNALSEEKAATHIQAIQSQVSKYWQFPPSSRRTMEVILEIKLIPTGEVIDVKVIRSSGNLALDRSAQHALVKASPLPVPKDIHLFEKYFRTLTMPFKPSNARL